VPTGEGDEESTGTSGIVVPDSEEPGANITAYRYKRRAYQNRCA